MRLEHLVARVQTMARQPEPRGMQAWLLAAEALEERMFVHCNAEREQSHMQCIDLPWIELQSCLCHLRQRGCLLRWRWRVSHRAAAARQAVVNCSRSGTIRSQHAGRPLWRTRRQLVS